MELFENCKHENAKVEFDEVAAKKLLEECEHPGLDGFGMCYQCVGLLRKKWPRFDGQCPDCKCLLISYASSAHFMYGDW